MEKPLDPNRENPENGPSGDDWLRFHAHLFQRAKQQEDVRDRWFRYYLLIMAALPTLMALAVTKWGAGFEDLSQFFPYLGLFFAVVGILFYSMFLNQRYNIRAYFTRMALLENWFLLPRLSKEDRIKLLDEPLKEKPNLGADKSVMCLFALVNSTFLGLSTHSIAIWLVSVVGHYFYFRLIETILERSQIRFR